MGLPEMYQDSYDQEIKTATKNYKSAAKVVNNTADAAINKQNTATNEGLQGAYIGNQQDYRNIGQKLAALGYNGGASETTMLGLQNNYRSNRAGMEKERTAANNATNLQRQADLASLLQALNTAKQTAYDKYSTNMANYYAQQEALAAQQQAAAAAGYGGGSTANAFKQSLIASKTPEENKAEYIPATMGYQDAMKYAHQLVNGGANAQDIKYALKNKGVSNTVINNILTQGWWS